MLITVESLCSVLETNIILNIRNTSIQKVYVLRAYQEAYIRHILFLN